ncbi:MAG: hypothetical protein EOO89_12350 [Pedobacter sp.]|nr:MAG: hypothetical protein EOO89_12350 [Pedobacter sp.]
MAKLAEAKARFENLSDADKQIAVQFLKANEEFFNLFKDLENHISQNPLKMSTSFPGIGKGRGKLMQTSASSGGCSKYVCQLLTTIAKFTLVVLAVETGKVAGVVVGGLVAIDVAYSLQFNKKSYLLSKGFEYLEIAVQMTYFAPNWSTKTIFDRIETDLATEFSTNKMAASANIAAGEEITFIPQITYRTLQKSDASSSNSLVRQTVAALEKAKTFYNSKLNGIAGAFPEYVNKTELVEAENLGDWELSILDNPKVTAGPLKGTGKKFTVVFSSDTKEDQAISLLVSYKADREDMNQTLNLNLVSRQAYKIEIIDGNNQSAVAGQKIPKALKVRVTDSKGEVLKDITVSWSVKSGGGSLTSAQSQTDANGIAQVEWTTGASGEQAVEASATKRDGSKLDVRFSAQLQVGNPLIGNWLVNMVEEKDYDIQRNQIKSSIEAGTETKYIYMEFTADNQVIYVYRHDGSREYGQYTYDPATSTVLIVGDGEYSGSVLTIKTPSPGKLLLVSNLELFEDEYENYEVTISKL